MNSRNKGKRGELEFAETLRGYGHVARRGQQFKGGADSPDVVVDTLPGVHFEVKRVEAGNLYKWMAQAARDAGFEIPIVAHRKSREDWVVILKLDDFLTYFTGALHGRQTDQRRPDSSVPSNGGIQVTRGSRLKLRSRIDSTQGSTSSRAHSRIDSKKSARKRRRTAKTSRKDPRSSAPSGAS